MNAHAGPLRPDPGPRLAAARGDARGAGSRAEWRLLLVAFGFLAGFAAVGGRMTVMAFSEPSEPARAASVQSFPARARIEDATGRPLAVNLPAASAFADPARMIDRVDAARRLAAAIPSLDETELIERFAVNRRFVWIKRPVSPIEKQTIHDLGIPGVGFGSRDVRVYPAGRVAAHVLGGARVGADGAQGAEILGRAGAELHYDAALRDPAREGAPLRLSIDLRAQAILTEVLRDAFDRFGAAGAFATLMDVRTGQVRALVSLPDFDPNARPAPDDPVAEADGRLRNRAVQDLYEFGSVFKPFAAAAALDRGVIGPQTLVDARGPLVWGRARFRDYYPMPEFMSVADMIAKSSNVATARVALMAGTPAMQDFLRDLGLTEATSLELAEASLGRPKPPERWSDLSTITISFGYGLSSTQLHLAAAYAALVNGGLRVRPTLDAEAPPAAEADRVMAAQTSAWMRDALRATVERGSGRTAAAPGYGVGGKTGTANKLNRDGPGYDETRTLASFAGVFPIDAPQYVLVVSIDEGEDRSGPQPRRTGGALAAPTAGEAIRRLAPALGLVPAGEAGPARLAGLP